jgi:Ca-activated chloride channel homolog
MDGHRSGPGKQPSGSPDAEEVGCGPPVTGSDDSLLSRTPHVRSKTLGPNGSIETRFLEYASSLYRKSEEGSGLHKFLFACFALFVFQNSFPEVMAGAVQEPNGNGNDSGVQTTAITGFALKIDVDTVFLNLSVRERATNRSLSGLQKNDFAAYEDGVGQEIDQFLPTESPFYLLLLLDVSGSTGSYLKLMKQAAIEFTREINAEDHIAIATFNSKVHLVQDFTNDRAAAEKAISKIKSGGGTAFYDALMTSVTRYMGGIQGRSAIVIFTDGIDNRLEGLPESGSTANFEDLFRKIQEADAIVYTIFLNTEDRFPSFAGGPSAGSTVPGWPGGRRSGGSWGPFPFPIPFPSSGGRHSRASNDGEDSVYRQARSQLQLITDQTGGRMYSPRKIDELSGAYQEVAEDLRVQYQLGYNSTNRVSDGRWRKIHVEVENYPEAVIRTRPGYYSRREAAAGIGQ